jgi:L-threonylcarbamoyladenylate synthase
LPGGTGLTGAAACLTAARLRGLIWLSRDGAVPVVWSVAVKFRAEPPTAQARALAADCLRSGGVVLLPTDTVYGLAAFPAQQSAVHRIFEIKNRPPSVNLPIMISRPDDVSRLGGQLNDASRRLLDSKFVPGPLTLAVGIDPEPVAWLAGRDEAAFRMPDEEWLLGLLGETGPLLVTSANVHAEPTRESVADILASLAVAPDLVIDGGMRSATVSTLVNCHLDPPVVERVGAVPAEEIEAILR